MRLRKQLLVYTCANTHVHVGVDTVLCACVSRVLTASVYMHVQLTPRVNKPETAVPACALPRPRQAPVQPHRLLWPWESLCVRGGRTGPSILEEEVPHGLTAAQQAHGKLPLHLSTELLSPAHVGTHTCKDTQHTQIHVYTPHISAKHVLHSCAHMHMHALYTYKCVHMCTYGLHVREYTCAFTYMHVHTYTHTRLPIMARAERREKQQKDSKTDHTRTWQKPLMGPVWGRRGRAQMWQQAGPATVSAAASAATSLPGTGSLHCTGPRTAPRFGPEDPAPHPRAGWALLPGLQVFDAGQHV